jgi:hypothetical protein
MKMLINGIIIKEPAIIKIGLNSIQFQELISPMIQSRTNLLRMLSKLAKIQLIFISVQTKRESHILSILRVDY